MLEANKGSKAWKNIIVIDTESRTNDAYLWAQHNWQVSHADHASTASLNTVLDVT